VDDIREGFNLGFAAIEFLGDVQPAGRRHQEMGLGIATLTKDLEQANPEHGTGGAGDGHDEARAVHGRRPGIVVE
jgi:hypothetical protein